MTEHDLNCTLAPDLKKKKKSILFKPNERKNGNTPRQR